MKTQITGREWEDLSAYLDGQLSPKESTRLEEKLQASADLRLALEELSRTRTLLRSQPPVRAPRNFLLSPKMVGERRAPAPANRLFPVMRLASALAMALFVLALAGDFLSSGRQPGVLPVAYQSVEMPAPAAVMKEASQADAPPAGEAMELPVATEAPAMEAPAEAKLAPRPGAHPGRRHAARERHRRRGVSSARRGSGCWRSSRSNRLHLRRSPPSRPRPP